MGIFWTIPSSLAFIRTDEHVTGNLSLTLATIAESTAEAMAAYRSP